LALVLANEHGTRLEVTPTGTALSRQAAQKRQAFTIEPAEGPLLDAAGNHASEQVLAEPSRRRSSEHGLPAPLKESKGKQSQASDLDRDRGCIDRVPPHGYARGSTAVSVGVWPATIR